MPQRGHSLRSSSLSTRYSTAATSPRTGTIAEITNHSQNELPFILPMTPPARPKKKAMTRYSPPTTGYLTTGREAPR